MYCKFSPRQHRLRRFFKISFLIPAVIILGCCLAGSILVFRDHPTTTGALTMPQRQLLNASVPHHQQAHPVIAGSYLPTTITLDFGTKQIILNEQTLQGGWYNYADKLALTHGKDLFSRATAMREADTFAGTFPDIIQFIDKIAPQFEIATYDGQINFFPHQTPRFTVTNQKAGRAIDRERLYWDILAALKGNKFPYIKVHYQEVVPTPPEKLVAQITKRSEFSTHFTNNPAREANIRLASAQFNGRQVNPGEEVSFNKVVGVRTATRGFQEAKIIINGEYVDGVGGGVCQVSTTIFNAVAQAGLQIIEAHNHSLPSSYVPLGTDAMVSNTADLRFVNNTGRPLYFETMVSDQTLHVTIYGRDKGPQITYRLATETVKTLAPRDQFAQDIPDTTLQDFRAHPENYDQVLLTPGVPGHTVETYLETYQGSRRLSRKFLRRATYKATPNRYTLRQRATPPPPDNLETAPNP